MDIWTDQLGGVQGECPYCESDDIEYMESGLNGDYSRYEYHVKCNECGKEFMESYFMEFDQHYGEAYQ